VVTNVIHLDTKSLVISCITTTTTIIIVIIIIITVIKIIIIFLYAYSRDYITHSNVQSWMYNSAIETKSAI